MTTQEELVSKRKEMQVLAETMRNLRKENPLQYDKEKYRLQEEYNSLHREAEKLRYKAYLETCNCQNCEDSGYSVKCCSDEDCQANVICYECEAYDKLDSED